jgi:hypothetical protein
MASAASQFGGTQVGAGRGERVVEGSFRVEPSQVVASTIRGKGFTVQYVSAGLYTVTILKPGRTMLSNFAHAQIGSAVNVDLYAQIGTVNMTTGVVQIQLKTGTANTAPPAADNANRVSFRFVMSTSGQNI